MAALPACAHCGSADVVGYMRLLDVYGENSAGDHELGFQEDRGGLFGLRTVRTPVRATVCASCGAIALFAIAPEIFAARFREAWPDPPPGDWPPTEDEA